MSTATEMKATAVLLLFCFAHLIEARVGPTEATFTGLLARRFLFLVDSPAVILDYHNGPILSGSNGSIPVYVIWYGNFNESDKTTMRDFFASFQEQNGTVTDVTRWWNTTSGFKDASGATVPGSITLAGEMNDTMYSKGKVLKDADIESLVLASLSTLPASAEAIYFVLTSADVNVDGFCMNACASHSATSPSATSRGLQLPYVWVGNPKDQCPGMCAWPYAQPSFMPPTTSLPLPPNGDVGADGMVIQVAYMLAGAATNPFDNAFYQGDAETPLEAGTACYGFGAGAYNGYPGLLEKDVITGAEYNANGAFDRKFLLPTLWDPLTRTCKPMSA